MGRVLTEEEARAAWGREGFHRVAPWCGLGDVVAVREQLLEG
jgi:hypothetical protein